MRILRNKPIAAHTPLSRHGNHQVGLHRVFARRAGGPIVLAHVVNAAPAIVLSGAREIKRIRKMQERAFLVFRKRLHAGQALFVDDDDFARLDVADEFRAWIWSRRDRLAGPATTRRSPCRWTTDESRMGRVRRSIPFRHDDERIRALDVADRLHERVLHAANRLGCASIMMMISLSTVV